MARKFTDPDNAKYAFDGYGLDHAFIATTGKPLIGLESGKLVSNLYDANIEKCMDMLRTFDDTQEQLRYPREIENNWTPSYNEWADGNTLFIEDGTWRYEETWRKFKKKNKWEDDEINFVPFPQMDGADTYYQEMKQDAYMFVSGSKNADGKSRRHFYMSEYACRRYLLTGYIQLDKAFKHGTFGINIVFAVFGKYFYSGKAHSYFVIAFGILNKDGMLRHFPPKLFGKVCFFDGFCGVVFVNRLCNLVGGKVDPSCTGA